MNRITRGLAALPLAAALFTGRSAPAQDAPPPPAGVTVQPRGPVHEAFARPSATPSASPVVPKEPPALINEITPDQKPDLQGVEWIPGYWAWDDEGKDFLWVSGTWRVPPPDRTWYPGSWAKVNGGWQWRSGFWGPTDPGGVRPLDATPPASLENGPSSPAPTADSYYVPGRWVFRDGQWAWQPGAWTQNQGNMVYVPPTYQPTQNGSLYIPGYWDYPLEDRGLLFAPVSFSGTPWVGNPGWGYQPGYTVGLGGLLGSLFLRPGYGNYYFGNYYGNPYRGLGYTPWTAYAGRGYDPLLNYYRWANRGTAGWSGGLTGLYAGRLNGTLPAPYTTYTRQAVAPRLNPNLIARNTATFNRNVIVNPVNSLQTVHPLNGTAHHVRLTSASPAAFTAPGGVLRSSFASPLSGRSSGFAVGQVPVQLPGNPVQLPGNPVQLPSPSMIPGGVQPGFRSFSNPQFRSVSPQIHRTAPAFRAAPAFRSAPSFHSAPIHRGAPAMRGHGGGHGGGGHGGGHRR